MSQAQFMDAVVRAAEVASKKATAEAIDNSLASGRLDPDLRTPAIPHRSGGRKDGGGTSEAEKAAREAERANRELEQTLRSLTSAYDPLADAEAHRAEQLADILKLEQSGKLDPARADFFRGKVSDEYFDTVFADVKEKGEADKKERAAERERQDQAIEGMLADQGRAVELQALDAKLIGASADQRERELGHLQFILDLQRQGLPIEDARVQALIRGNDALIAQGQAMADANRVLEEQRRIGENIIDTVLDPSAWDDWGELGKKVIRDLIHEMLLLAAINPLKNALFNSGLPTIGGGGGGILGFLGGIFGSAAPGGGGGDGIGGAILNLTSAFGGNAAGTEWADGGWRRVGEFGEELVRLPRGSQVVNAGRTRAMARAGTPRPAQTLNFDMRGAVVTADLLRQMQDMANEAAEQGASMGVRRTIELNDRTFGGIWG